VGFIPWAFITQGIHLSRGIHPKGVSSQGDVILFYPMTLIPLGIHPMGIPPIGHSSHRAFIPRGIHSECPLNWKIFQKHNKKLNYRIFKHKKN